MRKSEIRKLLGSIKNDLQYMKTISIQVEVIHAHCANKDFQMIWITYEQASTNGDMGTFGLQSPQIVSCGVPIGEHII